MEEFVADAGLAQAGPQEYQDCEYDVPPDGYACFAEGYYEVCDTSGFCSTYEASGAAWGHSEAAGVFWAEYDCEEFMTTMMILNSSTGTTGVVSECQVTACGPNE